MAASTERVLAHTLFQVYIELDGLGAEILTLDRPLALDTKLQVAQHDPHKFDNFNTRQLC